MSGNTEEIFSPHPNPNMGLSPSHTQVVDLDEDRVSIPKSSIYMSPKTKVVSIVALEGLVKTVPLLAVTGVLRDASVEEGAILKIPSS